MITIIKKATPTQEINKRLKEVFIRLPKKDITEYAGKLKADLDPLQFQLEMRNEWE